MKRNWICFVGRSPGTDDAVPSSWWGRWARSGVCLALPFVLMCLLHHMLLPAWKLAPVQESPTS